MVEDMAAEESLLDQEVGKVTLRDFLDVLGRNSKERVELAGILRDLNGAIDGVECTLYRPEATKKLKHLRETFNRIPPKWFHA